LGTKFKLKKNSSIVSNKLHSSIEKVLPSGQSPKQNYFCTAVLNYYLVTFGEVLDSLGLYHETLVSGGLKEQVEWIEGALVFLQRFLEDLQEYQITADELDQDEGLICGSLNCMAKDRDYQK